MVPRGLNCRTAAQLAGLCGRQNAFAPCTNVAIKVFRSLLVISKWQAMVAKFRPHSVIGVIGVIEASSHSICHGVNKLQRCDWVIGKKANFWVYIIRSGRAK